MAEAAEPCLDLEVERDNLREELQFVLTDLKKLDYDLAFPLGVEPWHQTLSVYLVWGLNIPLKWKIWQTGLGSRG